ncbi:MAG: hypothetical protein L0Z53_00505 [Acidobacteriales bacterium]|nr:hypothetical protein [Terriglobales bacterium]
MTILEACKANITANRSAAKSVVIRGQIAVEGSVVKIGSGPPEEKPLRRRGMFTYIADQFGRLKRWEVAWSVADRLGDGRYALAGSILLDASEKSTGYLRKVEEFSPDLDFYRDHWVFNYEHEIASLASAVEKHPEDWKLAKSADGAAIVQFETLAQGRELKGSVEIKPAWDYMIRRSVAIGGRQSRTWTWQQEPTSKIWYPANIETESTAIYPSGLTIKTERRFAIEEVSFNQEIREEKFTFADLGLNPGSTVYDMRFNPPRQYVFQPSVEYAGAIVAGVVPVAVGKEWERQQVVRGRWLRWGGLALLVLLAGVVAGFIYKRKRADKAGTAKA